MNLLAIDPAIAKKVYVANWLDLKFKGRTEFKYQELITGKTTYCLDPGEQNIAVIEKPYSHPKNNPQRQMNFFLGVGSIAQVFRTAGCEIVFAESWGPYGWLQQSFGRAVRSDVAIRLAIDKAKDYLQGTSCAFMAKDLEKRPDLAMSICLGMWWLATNRLKRQTGRV